MPDFTAPRRPFDWMGFFLFGLSLVSFSSGLEVFGDRVGPDFLPPVLLISGIALLGLYIRHARRHPSPLIRLSVFRTRTFSVGIGGNIVSRSVRAAYRSSCRSCFRSGSGTPRWWPGP